MANLRNDKTTSQEDIRKKNDELEMDVINENTTFHNSSDFRHKTSDLYISMNGQIAAMNLSSQKPSGPASLPFDDRHFALENKRNTSSTDYLPNKAQLPRRQSENSLGKFRQVKCNDSLYLLYYLLLSLMIYFK